MSWVTFNWQPVAHHKTGQCLREFDDVWAVDYIDAGYERGFCISKNWTWEPPGNKLYPTMQAAKTEVERRILNASYSRSDQP